VRKNWGAVGVGANFRGVIIFSHALLLHRALFSFHMKNPVFVPPRQLFFARRPTITSMTTALARRIARCPKACIINWYKLNDLYVRMGGIWLSCELKHWIGVKEKFGWKVVIKKAKIGIWQHRMCVLLCFATGCKKTRGPKCVFAKFQFYLFLSAQFPNVRSEFISTLVKISIDRPHSAATASHHFSSLHLKEDTFSRAHSKVSSDRKKRPLLAKTKRQQQLGK
jgi:hypothetical protein